jgi:hypothetical protein
LPSEFGLAGQSTFVAGFICVETAIAADEIIQLSPGEVYRVGATYRGEAL